MPPFRSPGLLTAAVVVSAVLAGLLPIDAAVAAPSAACTEPTAAAAARAALRTTLREQAVAFSTSVDEARQLRVRVVSRQREVLADPRSTPSAKALASAVATWGRRSLELAVAGRSRVVADRAAVERCGLAAVRRLAVRAHDRGIRFGIDKAIAFRAAGRAHLKWDMVSRDASAPGSSERATWDDRVRADEALNGVLTRVIRMLRGRLQGARPHADSSVAGGPLGSAPAR